MDWLTFFAVCIIILPLYIMIYLGACWVKSRFMVYESVILDTIYTTGSCKGAFNQTTNHTSDEMANSNHNSNQMANNNYNNIKHNSSTIKDKISTIFHHIAGRLKVFDGGDRFLNIALDLAIDACASMENKADIKTNNKIMVVPRHSVR